MAINVNTLPTESAIILSSLIEGLSLSGAETVLSSRPEKGFDDLEAFLKR